MFDLLNVCAICGRLFRKCWFLGGLIFENDFFHERGRRGRSRRENSAKILAAAFSRREFLMVLGGGGEGQGDPRELVIGLRYADSLA